MDDTAATTPSPSSTATTAAGYDVARDKTNADVAAASVTANSGSSSSGVRLLIKSSNQQYDDMNIESDLCWTVQRLKKQLSLVYPGKPEINEQKLIYSGKLLDDAQKLSEVIRSYKDVYQQHHIFHLVCASKNVTKTPYKMTTPPRDTTAAPQQDSVPNDNELRQRHVAANANAANAANIATAQLPYQHSHLQHANAMHSWLHLQHQAFQMAAVEPTMATAQAAVAATAAPSFTASHLAFHQQQQQQAILYNAWVQQCYAVYMQQMMHRTDSGHPPPMTPSMVQRFIMLPNNLSVPPLVGHQPVPVAAAVGAGAAGQPNEAAVAQQPAARPVDAPNFPNIQEEPEMRDWLDSFFSFTRLAIFVTVLYFNSSPMRCLLVVLIASIIYLYHIGVLRRRRERNNNNINRNNNANGDNVGAFVAVQQLQRMMDAAVERDNNPQAAAEPAPAAAQDDAPAAAEPASVGADQAGLDAAAAAAEAVVVEPANANNSVISIVRTYVVTFFTSLLPEAPAL